MTRRRYNPVILLLRRSIAQTLGVAAALVAAGAAPSEVAVRFEGHLAAGDDLSAVERVGRALVLASDEGERLQVLDPVDEAGTRWTVRADTMRLLGVEREVDVEGLAADGTHLYVLGSHSIKRKLLEADEPWNDNRTRLATVLSEPERHRVFRLRCDPRTGRITGPPDSISLRPILESDPILAPFTRIPGKENGVDAEGLALDGSTLVVGFVSPVLREGFVPVLRVSFEDPTKHEVRWARFGGLGIRSLARVADGFLVIASSAADDADAELWLWDGRDRLPGSGAPRSRAEKLLSLPARGGMPEGMTVMDETADAWDVLILHDGVDGGRPVRLHVAKPVSPGGGARPRRRRRGEGRARRRRPTTGR
jgi:hypothetical protein